MTTKFREDIYDHSCKVLEAAAVDSAENEIVSIGDMRSGPVSFAPNCKWVLRDAAHSLRRVPQRLFRCDEVVAGKDVSVSYFFRIFRFLIFVIFVLDSIK